MPDPARARRGEGSEEAGAAASERPIKLLESLDHLDDRRPDQHDEEAG
jgi:hypothetical protein